MMIRKMMVLIIIIFLSFTLISNYNHGYEYEIRYQEKSATMRLRYFGPVNVSDHRPLPDNVQHADYYSSIDDIAIFLQFMDYNRTPIEGGEVICKITMGDYENITRGVTDSEGFVYFEFTSILRDTDTKEKFKVAEGLDEENVTYSWTFIGNDEYRACCMIRERWISPEDSNEDETNLLNLETIKVFIICNGIILLSFGMVFTFYIIVKKFHRY